jgi:hypothetical protein
VVVVVVVVVRMVMVMVMVMIMVMMVVVVDLLDGGGHGGGLRTRRVSSRCSPHVVIAPTRSDPFGSAGAAACTLCHPQKLCVREARSLTCIRTF